MDKPIDITEGVKLTPERRSGNSTRLVDNAIQLLFTHGWIKVIDHYGGREASKFLFKRVIQRIKNEHPSLKIIEDRNNFTIMNLSK